MKNDIQNSTFFGFFKWLMQYIHTLCLALFNAMAMSIFILFTKGSKSCQFLFNKPLLREGRRVFVGVIKNFRHALMGQEIIFKIFDVPQNILFPSIFIILYFKSRGWSTKYPN